MAGCYWTMEDNFTFSSSSSFDTSHDKDLLKKWKEKVLHEEYVSLLGFLFLFQRKTNYKPYSPRRWTSPFRFRYLNVSIPVRQQGIHQIPKRHPRLFQAVVSCGVFLGPMYDVRRWRHLHRVKPHKVSKMKI